MFRPIIILTSCMLSSCLYAASIMDLSTEDRLVLGLSVGPTWSSGNKSQTFYLEPDVIKTYTADNNTNTFPSAEFFVGWQRPWIASGQPLLTQLGIAIAGAGNAELSGDIWEDADPTFDNYNYNYKVNHFHVAIKGRLIGNCHRFLEPYLSASLGVGFNHAYGFNINPKIVEEVPAPPFRSNTTTTFTYTLGLGLQKAFTPQFQAAIGYEFADWGRVALSPAPGQTTNQGLKLNHLYAHQLQFALFYIV